MEPFRRARGRWWVSGLLIVAAAVGGVGGAGCVGVLEDDPVDPGKQPGPTETADHGMRLPRLSHTQWARTAQAFLRLTDPPTVSLRPDTLSAEGFETDDRARSIDSTLVRNYRTQFQRIIAGQGYDGLLTKMKTKLNEERVKDGGKPVEPVKPAAEPAKPAVVPAKKMGKAAAPNKG